MDFNVSEMNSIASENCASEFIKEPHWQLVIDGKTLDRILHEIRDGDGLLGLVPAVDFLYDSEERRIARDLACDFSNGSRRVPLLICPDDLDFSCTTIIVDACFSNSRVEWKRIGVSIAEPLGPESVYEEVSWYQNIPMFAFSREAYENAFGELLRNTANR